MGECIRHHTPNCEQCALDSQQQYQHAEAMVKRHETGLRLLLPRTVRNFTKHRHRWERNKGYHYSSGGWATAFECHCGAHWEYDEKLNPVDYAQHKAMQDAGHKEMFPR